MTYRQSKMYNLPPEDCSHKIENKQKGHSSPHACRLTYLHYTGSGQSIAFSG